MSIIYRKDIRCLIAPSAIFNAEINTDAVKLDNAQAVHFVVQSGTGTEQKVKAKVMMGDAYGIDDKMLSEHEIIIGGEKLETIIADADYIAKHDFDRVYLQIENASNANLVGCILAVMSNERYSN